MTGRVCSVDGCGRPTRSGSAELCNPHYFRVWRTGSTGTRRDLGPQAAEGAIWDRRQRTCTVAGCEKPHYARGYCLTHDRRARNYGDPLHVELRARVGEQNGSWRGDAAGYTAVHDRVRRWRGSARDSQCAHCGERAAHQWSYDHADPAEKRDPSGPPYSTDLAHYVPLCVPCHKVFDLKYLGRR